MSLPDVTDYNVYCDESCHLEHDSCGVMVLGAVWCPTAAAAGIHRQLRQIKVERGLSTSFEIKWNGVSPGGLPLYLDCLRFFFSQPDLHFRAIVVPDKTILVHARFGQTHDEWYYKMYFEMLKTILTPSGRFHIYLDIKDTRGAEKVAKLRDVLCNSMYDFSRLTVDRVQTVRSHEVQAVQLADLLIGAVAYANRGLSTSQAKLALVKYLREQSGYMLTRTTLLREDKVNILCWRPNEAGT